MSLGGLLTWLVVGAIAGWLAGVVVEGHGFGIVGNIIVGIVGAFVGGRLFGQLGIASGQGVAGSIVGAVMVIFLLRLVRPA